MDLRKEQGEAVNKKLIILLMSIFFIEFGVGADKIKSVSDALVRIDAVDVAFTENALDTSSDWDDIIRYLRDVKLDFINGACPIILKIMEKYRSYPLPSKGSKAVGDVMKREASKLFTFQPSPSPQSISDKNKQIKLFFEFLRRYNQIVPMSKCVSGSDLSINWDAIASYISKLNFTEDACEAISALVAFSGRLNVNINSEVEKFVEKEATRLLSWSKERKDEKMQSYNLQVERLTKFVKLSTIKEFLPKKVKLPASLLPQSGTHRPLPSRPKPPSHADSSKPLRDKLELLKTKLSQLNEKLQLLSTKLVNLKEKLEQVGDFKNTDKWWDAAIKDPKGITDAQIDAIIEVWKKIKAEKVNTGVTDLMSMEEIYDGGPPYKRFKKALRGMAKTKLNIKKLEAVEDIIFEKYPGEKALFDWLIIK